MGDSGKFPGCDGIRAPATSGNHEACGDRSRVNHSSALIVTKGGNASCGILFEATASSASRPYHSLVRISIDQWFPSGVRRFWTTYGH
jgi:hypothetical protein